MGDVLEEQRIKRLETIVEELSKLQLEQRLELNKVNNSLALLTNSVRIIGQRLNDGLEVLRTDG